MFWAGSLMSQVLQWTQLAGVDAEHRLAAVVGDFVDAGGAIERRGLAVAREVVADRDGGIAEDEVDRLVLVVGEVGEVDRGGAVEGGDAVGAGVGLVGGRSTGRGGSAWSARLWRRVPRRVWPPNRNVWTRGRGRRGTTPRMVPKRDHSGFVLRTEWSSLRDCRDRRRGRACRAGGRPRWRRRRCRRRRCRRGSRCGWP